MPGVIVRKVPVVNSNQKGGASTSTVENNWKSGRPSKENKSVGAEWAIYTTRGTSVLNGDYSLPVLIDRAKYEKEDLDFILYMSAFEIESVELLRPWQTLAYTNGALHGAILVKTRAYKDRPPLPSKGAMYTPTGISKLNGTFQPEKWEANQSGFYRLIVDVFTDKEIRSYEHRFEVVEDKDM